MLVFENPFTEIDVNEQDVRGATLYLCGAGLVRVAQQTQLDLGTGSYYHFRHLVQGVIESPEVAMTPSELIGHSQMLALRGAQAALARGETGFHEYTWSWVCPVWPFC